MRTTWLISAAVILMAGGGLASGQLATPEKSRAFFESPVRPVPVSQIDKLVFAKLSARASSPCFAPTRCSSAAPIWM